MQVNTCEKQGLCARITPCPYLYKKKQTQNERSSRLKIK